MSRLFSTVILSTIFLLLASGRANADDREKLARSRIQDQSPRIARAVAPDVRANFLKIERFARQPDVKQEKQLPRLYNDLAPRYMNPFITGILSSYPDNILDRKSYAAPGGDCMTRWAKNLADAEDEMTPKQVADRLESGLMLNVAAQARAVQVLTDHQKLTEKLIRSDLDSGDAARIDRASATILTLELNSFADQLLSMFIEDDKSPESVFRALLFIRNTQLIEPLTEQVKKDPEFLTRSAGLFQGPLWRKPATPLLLNLLDSPNADIRNAAIRAVYECTDPKLAAYVVKFAKDEKVQTRNEAVYLASNLPPESFKSVRNNLLPLLSDEDESVRIAAIRCFAKQKDIAAGPFILNLLKQNQLGTGYQVTVMQALSALTGTHYNYFMHNWGPESPGNQRAIEKFEAWLEEHDSSKTMI